MDLRKYGFITFSSVKMTADLKHATLYYSVLNPTKKIEIINEANSYTEEVRRKVKNIYGFEKLYSQGLSISTPLNIKYQIQALKS